MKRILSILLAAILLFSVVPMTAGAVIARSATPESGDAAIPQRESVTDLADTGAIADAAPTGESMKIIKQPAEKLYISKYYSSDTHPIYPYIVFGVGGGTGVYTFDWYFSGDDEYAIGEKIATTTGPVYQPTEPGYYHCWVHDSSGDSVFCDRTLVQLDNRAQELKGCIHGTRLEWYESAATGLRRTSYRIYVSRKDTTHNTYDGLYLNISAGLDGSISDFYSHIDNYDYHFTDEELAAYDPTYDAEKHMYSFCVLPLLRGFTNYDDIEYQFKLYDSTYSRDDLIYSDYLPVKKLNGGLIVQYFPTDLWREGEVQINDGDYIPGSVLKPNLTCGRWAGQESKVKVILQEYYQNEWSDVREVSGTYIVKTEDINKRLRFKVMPKDPYERYVGELYWEKEAFYSNAVSITKPVKYITGTVNCTITEPKVGVTASTAISFTDTNNMKYFKLSADTASKTGLDWYFSNGQIANNYTFDGGSTYTAEVYFELINQDSSYIYNYDGLKVYFNGKEATVSKQGMKYLAAKRNYTLPEANAIDRVSINVTKPVAGSFPTFSATANGNIGWNVESSYSLGYYQNGVLWRNVTDGYYMTSQTSDESNRFEKGKRYQVTVSLIITSNYYIFADKSLVTGSVNQYYATVGNYNDGNEGRNIYLEYTFDLDDTVRDMSFTVSEPAIGGKPIWTVDYPSGGRYYVDDLTVSWYEDGWSMMKSDTFKAGSKYTVKFRVDADDDCKFTDETVALINGKTATITEKWTDSYGDSHVRVEYTFTFSAPVVTINSVAVTVSEPEAGKSLRYTASVPAGVGYAVEDYDCTGEWKDGVQWKDESGNVIDPDDGAVFQRGKTYTVAVSVILSDSDAYAFDKDNFNATINGVPIEGRLWFGGDNVIVWHSFTLAGGSSGSYIIGDADTDKNVTILDATAIQRTLAKLRVDKFDDKAADADEDGKVTILDATDIQRYLAKLSCNPNIGTSVG